MILVCGEALMDVLVEADGNRRPVPGGGPFNTARALARLDVPSAFLGRLSEDAYGQQLTRALREDGVSLDFATWGSEPTTLAIATRDAAGVADFRFETEGTSAEQVTLEMLPTELGPDVEALHVGTLGLVLEPMATTLVELVRRERGRRLVMVDPNIRDVIFATHDRVLFRHRLEHDVLPASTVVKASAEDLAWLYPGLEVETACARILDLGPCLVVATLGGDGAYGLTRQCQARVGVPPVTIVDTIGAGDIFGAALLAWLHDHRRLSTVLRLERAELEAALASACEAAAWTCTRAGADPPTRRDL